MIEWALRSAILILAGAALLTALRIKDASIRLAVWTAILFGSLAIPVMTTALPVLPVHLSKVSAPSAPSGTVQIDNSGSSADAVNPGGVGDLVARRAESVPFNWSKAAGVVYLLVALAMLLRLCVGLAICRRLVRKSRPTEEPGIRESDTVSAPVTLGIIRPAIVLPANWRDWDETRRTAVMAHERSHIERYDPALQLLSAIHRALLWFSPATWFLHSRILRVAEEASDDAAVEATGDRATYAEILLDFVRKATPQASLAGVPMARYGRPDQRINRILDGTSLSRGVTRGGVAAILALAMPITYFAATAQPQVVAAPIAMPRTAAPITVAQEAPPPMPQPPVPPPPPPAPRPKFDVASIRPCDPNAALPGGRSAKTGGATTRFRRNCVSVMTLMQDSYVRFADGKNRSPMLTDLTKIEGGPAWINSDQYSIEAEAEGNFPLAMQVGPMVQALLEDRFRLKVRRESREAAAYALTASKTGVKIQPAKEGPCVKADNIDSPFPYLEPPPEMAQETCRFFWNARKGLNVVVAARSTSMEQLAAHLTRVMDRLVIDKTGIKGDVDFRFSYSPDDSTPWSPTVPPADGVPSAEDPAGPSIFTALQQQLGLKLEPTRAAREYIVIESISRPTPN